MSATASGQLDMDAFRRATRHVTPRRSPAMYAPDATAVMVDHEHSPSQPQRLEGREAIRAMLDDVCSRDMTHEVTHAVASPAAPRTRSRADTPTG